MSQYYYDDHIIQGGTIDDTVIGGTTPAAGAFTSITATNSVVVKASNSSFAGLHTAAYICDGTADDVQIQAAIDAMPSTGGIIFLSDGDFYIASAITFSKKQLRFVGQGAGCTKIYLANSANCRMFGYDSAETQSGVQFEHIYFDGNKANNTSGSVWDNMVGAGYLKDVTFFHCAFFNFNDTPILIKQAWGTYIEWCIIENCDDAGIQITQGSNAKILHNKIHNNTGHAIHLGGTAALNRVTILGCELEGGSGNAGIYFDNNVSFCNVTGSFLQDIRNWANYGIYMNGTNVGNTIQGCQFMSTDTAPKMLAGIQFQNAASSNNMVMGCGFDPDITTAIVDSSTNKNHIIGCSGIANIKKESVAFYSKTAGAGSESYFYGYDFDDTADENLTFVSKVPTDIDVSQAAYIKFIFCPTATQTGGDQKVVIFNGVYNIVDGSGVIGNGTSVTDVSTTLAVDEVLRTQHIVTYITFAAGTLAPGDMISALLQRDVDPNDTGVGDMMATLPWLEYAGTKMEL